MRHLYFFLTVPFLLFTLFAIAQEEVSEVVQDSFYNRHPGAFDVIWDHQKQLNRYVVRFYDGAIKKGAVYDSTGGCLEELTYLPQPALPHSIAKQLSTQYDNFQVGGILRIRRPEEPLIYRVRLVSDTSYQDVRFNQAGEVLERSSPD